MAIYIIPKPVQRLWDKWNLRGAVLFSLLLQILLIFLAGSRKRAGRGRHMIIGVVWLAYLMADIVATFAVGLVVNNLSSGCNKSGVHNEVAAFWASFLLLHLGGPDSITAFSVEDNELWKRHFLGLVSQVSLVVYVVLLEIPNPFWIPSVLIFLSGTIQYGERTTALFQACWKSLDSLLRSRIDDPIPIHDFSVRNVDIEPEMKAVVYGFKFYELVVRMLTLNSWHISEESVSFSNYKDVMMKQDAREAFEILEVEINCLYDKLFTKRGMHTTGILPGFECVFRLTCTALIVASFLIFSLHEKPEIHPFDTAISYTLLVGAVLLDFVGIIEFVFSVRTINYVQRSNAQKVINMIRTVLFPCRNWSERIYAHNLIDQCLKDSSSGWMHSALNYFEECPHIKYRSPNGERLRDQIFNHIKGKPEIIPDRELSQENMSWDFWIRNTPFYERSNCFQREMKMVKRSFSYKFGYNESILLWHVATNLLYYKTRNSRNIQANAQLRDNAEVSKALSDYLFYLVVSRSTLMPSRSERYRYMLRTLCS